MPIDDSLEQKTPRSVRGSNFSRVTPTPLVKPFKGVYSDECLSMIGLAGHQNLNQDDLAERLCGNKLFEGS